MKLKKICSVVVAAALTFSLSVTPILADEVSDLKKQKKDTEEQVNSLQTQLNSLMTKISELENDLITTGEEISQTEEDLKAAAGRAGAAVSGDEASYQVYVRGGNRKCNGGKGTFFR